MSDPLLICVPVILLPDPAVESTIRVCERCQQQVWMSCDSERVFAQGCTIVCTPCAVSLPSDGGIDGRMTVETRQRLRDMGFTDAHIDTMLTLVTKEIENGTLF